MGACLRAGHASFWSWHDNKYIPEWLGWAKRSGIGPLRVWAVVQMSSLNSISRIAIVNWPAYSIIIFVRAACPKTAMVAAGEVTELELLVGTLVLAFSMLSLCLELQQLKGFAKFGNFFSYYEPL